MTFPVGKWRSEGPGLSPVPGLQPCSRIALSFFHLAALNLHIISYFLEIHVFKYHWSIQPLVRFTHILCRSPNTSLKLFLPYFFGIISASEFSWYGEPCLMYWPLQECLKPFPWWCFPEEDFLSFPEFGPLLPSMIFHDICMAGNKDSV